MWILLKVYNDYDQHGGYFSGVFESFSDLKASVNHLGRLGNEYCWYKAFNDKLWCFEGTIDSDYDGEIGVQLFNTGEFPKIVLEDQAIAQLVIVPYIVDKSLVKNVTREGGFGSTD